MEIKELYLKNYLGQDVKINGWIRSHRKQAHFGLLIFLMVLVLNLFKLFMMKLCVILKKFLSY